MEDLEKKEIEEQLAEFIPDVDAREILISSYTSYINVNRSYFIADKLVDIDFYNKMDPYERSAALYVAFFNLSQVITCDDDFKSYLSEIENLFACRLANHFCRSLGYVCRADEEHCSVFFVKEAQTWILKNFYSSMYLTKTKLTA